MKKIFFYLLLLACGVINAQAENGYRLWLRYDKVTNKLLYDQYRKTIAQLDFPANSATLTAAYDELTTGLAGLIQLQLPLRSSVLKTGTLVAGTPG